MSKMDAYTKEELENIVHNSHSMSNLSYNLGYTRGGNNRRIIKEYLKKYHISTAHFQYNDIEQVHYSDDQIFCANSKAAQTTLRRRYTKGNYTEYKCAICDQEPIWNGKTLTLTLDHINGVNNDNRLENLRWVCPNCDRQLDTFCSKNAKRIEKKKYYCIDCGAEIDRTSTRCVKCNGVQARLVERPEPEELKAILISHNGNFTEVASMFKITDNAIRKWCKEYDMPFHSKDYKNKQQSGDC